MGERQLRSRSMATRVEAAPQDSESCHCSMELGYNDAEIETLGNKESNTQIEVQIGDEEECQLTIRLTNLRGQMTVLQCLQSS
jgi:hypothetical protein